MTQRTHPPATALRALLLLAATTMVVLALADVARAGTFTYHACKRASGGFGTSTGWTGNPGTNRQTAVARCETHGDVAVEFLGSGPYAPGLLAEAIWQAPAGMTFEGVRYRRRHAGFGAVADRPYSGHNAWYVSTGEGGRWTGRESCANFGGMSCPASATTDASLGGLNADRLRVQVHCWDTVPAPGCGQPQSDGPPRFAFEWLKFRLRDTTTPVVGRLGGAVATNAAHAGTETLEADLTDIGSGAYRTRVVLDGTVVAQDVVDDNDGRCRDADPDNADPYEFDAVVPCRLAHRLVRTVDLRNVAEGRHDLRIVVEDAAGNATTVFADETFLVDNVPAAVATAEPRVAGTAATAQTLTVQAGAWTGALGEPAYQWLRCDSLGGGCVAAPGARDDRYVVGADDVGKRLRVRVTRVNAAGETTSADSAPTELVGVPTTGGTGTNGTDGANGAAGSGGPAGPAGTTTGVLVPNGEPASRSAQLAVAFTNGTTIRSTRWGTGAAVAGRLTDGSGRAIRGAVVDVAETPSVRGAAPAVTRTVTTDGDGRFAHAVDRRASSRTIAFAYAAERGGPAVTRAAVRLDVTAAVKLSVRLSGSVVRYTGHVLSGPMPAGGKLVILQGRVKGRSWQTFATRRASGSGRFSGRYRLKARVPGRTLQFRAQVVAEAGYPYRPVTSKAVSRRVR